MSSTTTDAAAAAAMERQTYWCYECDTSISLLPPSSLLCPHCRSDFLVRLDSPPSNPSSSPDPNLSQFPIPIDPPSLSPASQAAVAAIPTIKITALLLELDPILPCAVCKDPFAIDDEAKQLPCKHMYHPCCILPWLSQRNSCPVCRFLLPTENNESTERARRRMSSGLTAASRRRRSGLIRDLTMDRWQEQSGVEEESLLPLEVIGEAEAGLVELSLETMPRWLVEGGANASAGGNGES